jgi:hypothetical protein
LVNFFGIQWKQENQLRLAQAVHINHIENELNKITAELDLERQLKSNKLREHEALIEQLNTQYNVGRFLTFIFGSVYVVFVVFSCQLCVRMSWKSSCNS